MISGKLNCTFFMVLSNFTRIQNEPANLLFLFFLTLFGLGPPKVFAEYLENGLVDLHEL